MEQKCQNCVYGFINEKHRHPELICRKHYPGCNLEAFTCNDFVPKMGDKKRIEDKIKENWKNKVNDLVREACEIHGVNENMVINKTTGVGMSEIASIGKKFDTGKPRLAETIQDFRDALAEVSRVWAFGADKYEKGNWRFVDNALDRYTNALMRHLCAEADSLKDDESELLHAAHVAWNALARLHFILENQKKVGTK